MNITLHNNYKNMDIPIFIAFYELKSYAASGNPIYFYGNCLTCPQMSHLILVSQALLCARPLKWKHQRYLMLLQLQTKDLIYSFQPVTDKCDFKNRSWLQPSVAILIIWFAVLHSKKKKACTQKICF